MKKLKVSHIINIALVAFLVAFVAFKFYEPDFEKDAEEGIQFHKGSFKEAVELAREQDKLIFMDVYATWCGPCKMLKLNTFSTKKAGDYFNENFVNLSIDGEKGHGIKIAKTYGVEAYPSLFIIDPHTLKPVETATGFKSAGQLIRFAEVPQQNKKKAHE